MTHLRLAALLLAAVGAGCGLISSDVTNFDLTLPDKNFTVDTSGWQIDQMQAMTFLQTSCASQPTLCPASARRWAITPALGARSTE